jgi:hypothetical protein
MGLGSTPTGSVARPSGSPTGQHPSAPADRPRSGAHGSTPTGRGRSRVERQHDDRPTGRDRRRGPRVSQHSPAAVGVCAAATMIAPGASTGAGPPASVPMGGGRGVDQRVNTHRVRCSPPARPPRTSRGRWAVRCRPGRPLFPGESTLTGSRPTQRLPCRRLPIGPLGQHPVVRQPSLRRRRLGALVRTYRRSRSADSP